jgi:hypothetical protein
VPFSLLTKIATRYISARRRTSIPQIPIRKGVVPKLATSRTNGSPSSTVSCPGKGTCDKPCDYTATHVSRIRVLLAARENSLGPAADPHKRASNSCS